MRNLRDYSYNDLLREVASMGEKPYRAVQLSKWIFQKGITEIDAMTDVSKAFRERLKEEFFIGGIRLIKTETAADETRKFLCRLDDDNTIESVLIKEDNRLTLCVSTQAGCALGCRFCMTGMAGFIRNLTHAELTGQVFIAEGIMTPDERITNIVLMGMGEPLNNYDNVVRFIQTLTDDKGFGFSHNRVTLSTSGVVPGIKRLGTDGIKVNLAISLNATTDEVRTRIMPINKKYPIEELIQALRDFPLGTRKYLTIEYVLIKNVNDSAEDARRLIILLAGIPCKINLIPFNPFPGTTLQRPEDERVTAFYNIVVKADCFVSVRSSKGADINAACGQLRGASSMEEAE